MSELSEKIKKLREESKANSNSLYFKDGQSEVVQFETDAKGEVVGEVFERDFQGKKTNAVRFEVTIVSTGEKKAFPLSLKWADLAIGLMKRRKTTTLEVTRTGEGKRTTYDFQAV